ncbi:unnamed protein product [Rhizopus stolonifer]
MYRRCALKLAEPTPTIENESKPTTENDPIPTADKEPTPTTIDNEPTPIPTGCIESTPTSNSESIIENEAIAAESNISPFHVTITSQPNKFSKEDEVYKLLSSGCLNTMNEICRS